MEFKIRVYNDDYLIQQVKLVNSLQNNWVPRPFLQTVKDYRETFSGESFDPELNLYGFQDQNLVVIINSLRRDQSLIIEPYVLSENIDQLRLVFDHLLKKLQNYDDISQIVTVGGPGWPNRLKIIEMLGFVTNSQRFVSATIKQSDLPIPAQSETSNLEIMSYNEELHYEGLRALFLDKFGFPPEIIEKEIKEMYKLKALTVSWKVALDDDNVVGHGLLIVDKPNHDYAYLREILTKNEDDRKIFNQIYMTLISDLKEFNQKIKTLTFRLGNNHQAYIDNYENMGIKFDQYNSYIVPLN